MQSKIVSSERSTMSSSGSASDDFHGPTTTTLELSVKGQWTQVPALNVDGTHIIVNGRWLRMASVPDEEWLEAGNPQPRNVCAGAEGACRFGFPRRSVYLRAIPAIYNPKIFLSDGV